MSGGELQRVAIALCLGKPADVYLIDEPSAYLDSEQRLHAAKVIKRFILHAKKTGKVKKFKLPRLDLISSPLPFMKIQIVGGIVTKNLRFESPLCNFCPF